MKHCIIVKFKKDVDYKTLVPNIKNLFDNCKTIEGINDVFVYENCVDRDNRYHIMIQLVMDKDALPIYDECIWHHTWKKDYGFLIEYKTIFDYEE